MTKKITKNALTIIFLSWSVFSFVLLDFNPVNWDTYARFWFVLLIFSFVCLFITTQSQVIDDK